MPKIAIIEDDRPTSNQLSQWAARAVPDAQIDQLFTRQDAEAAFRRTQYDLITLDIELGAERNAGVALIKEATKARPVPVLVVSGMPADLYRGVMKALEAWDYLQKPVGEHDFNQTLLSMLSATAKPPAPQDDRLLIDPLTQAKPTWKGKRLNLTATQQRLLNVIYERRTQLDPTVAYEELYPFLMSGKNTSNLKRQISQIRDAFSDVEGVKWNGIVAEPLRGYRWVTR
jgi:two-component system response regulator ChvI